MLCFAARSFGFIKARRFSGEGSSLTHPFFPHFFKSPEMRSPPSFSRIVYVEEERWNGLFDVFRIHVLLFNSGSHGCPAGSSFYQPPPVLPVSRPRRKSLFNKLARESMIFLHDTSRAFILRPIIPIGKILLSRSVVSGVQEPFECQGRRRNSKKDRTSANFEERYVDIFI